MRNQVKEEPKEEPKEETKTVQEKKPEVQIMEREITLTLLNEKLNYITGILHNLAEIKTK